MKLWPIFFITIRAPTSRSKTSRVDFLGCARQPYSVRGRLRSGCVMGSSSKNGEQVVGNKTRVKVVKKKVAPPFRDCEFEITYGTGISAVGEIVDLASEAGLIVKSGAYYSICGERIAQGRDKACQYLGEHPALADELRDKLVALHKEENARLGAPVPVGSGENADA